MWGHRTTSRRSYSSASRLDAPSLFPKLIDYTFRSGVYCHALLTWHQKELATATRHLAEARTIVSRQPALVERMKAKGRQLEMHQQTLRMFEMTLQSFEEHERLLREEVAIEMAVAPPEA